MAVGAKDCGRLPLFLLRLLHIAGQQFPTVAVKGGETTKGVILRIGARAAHLVYQVIDEDRKPIPGGSFVFNRLDQDNLYSIGVLGKGDMLVPPDPFRVTFEAKGYRPWHYGGDNWQQSQGVISLKSGESLNLTIHLQRD